MRYILYLRRSKARPTSKAALAKVFTPTGDRGLTRRVRRLAELRGTLPDGDGKSAVDLTLNRLANEMAYKEDRAARRVVDFGTLGAMTIVAILAFGVTWLCWLGPLWLKFVGGGVAVFATLLILVGGLSQLLAVREQFEYEKSPSAK